ncbi:MAG: glycoside hydrolase family 3 C-terminal domain-containing protein [Candidatus Azobacteroides sp.]|nr:glycoside hydrolase family 3 C-terminal domain-containing protein [Candidatus Azobacteroides sp.]
MKCTHKTGIVLLWVFFVSHVFAQISGFPAKGDASKYYNDPVIKEKVEKLLSRMTLEEKIGQLTLFAAKGIITGPGESGNIEEFIRKGQCGNIFGTKTVEDVIRLQKIAVEESRLKIPLLFGFDVIHGFKTIFPVNIGISASWDMEEIERFAHVSAEEASAAGLNWTFSPMCDISRDPRWGRVSEGCGEDSYLASHITAAMVKAYQGNDLKADNTILACVKHFIAYGAAEAGRDYNTVDMSERVLRDIYLPPYRAAIDAGAATVMTAFNEYDGIPVTANRFLLKKILREEIGFNGFVVTDFTAINELIPHGIAGDSLQAAQLAIDAGVNVDMVGNVYLFYLKQLVNSGKVSMETIDKLCGEVLKFKYYSGLFDDPFRYCKKQQSTCYYKDEYLESARNMAKKSMVLLQNNNGALPIAKGQKIALIGPFADTTREMLGSWAIAGEPSKTTTFFKGLQMRFGKENVFMEQCCKPDAEIENGFDKALKLAEQSDVILLTLGLPQSWSGEAASLTSIRLPELQTSLLREIKKAGKPIVILLVTARPLDLSQETELADAILVTWNPGTKAGEALADVLSGDYNPSGKLTMTFPRNIGQIPVYYNHKNTGRPVGFQSSSNQKYTSCYLFTPNEPLFPFGYGLSYTTFEYSDIKVKNPVAEEGDTVVVSGYVKNTGKVAGEEVIQLYIRDLIGSVTRPVRELKGFRKIFLQPGESKEVTFLITPDDLSFYRADMTFGQETGEYHVWIGGNSNATLQSEFEIK